MKNILFSILMYSSIVGIAQQVIKVGMNQQNIENCINSATVDVFSQESFLKVFPNPANDILNIRVVQPGDNTYFHINLSDALGQIVMQHTESSIDGVLTIRLEVKNFPKGIYFLQIHGNSFKAMTKVIIAK